MAKRTHGMSTSSEYCIWRGILTRCLNKNSSMYPVYGGRGISVCERWKVFDNFYKDMGDRPKGLSIDRIDNDGNYCPENCRWATKEVQHSNKRGLRLITAFGETKSLSAWARSYNISVSLLRKRLDYYKMTIEQALLWDKYDE